MNKLVRIIIILATFTQAAMPQDPWILQNSGLTGDIKFISTILVPDSLTVWGFVLDYNKNPPFGEFTRTMNGGTTWQTGSIESSSNYRLMSAAALNKDTAWVAGVRTTYSKGDIFRTYDGGAHWIKPDTSIYKGFTSFPDDIYFFDKDTGFCFGDPDSGLFEGGHFEIYRTVNSGDSWTRIPYDNIPPSLEGEGCYNDVKCIVHDTVWIGSTMGRVFKSVDKGLHWSVSNAFESDAVIDIAFRDGRNGLIFGGYPNNSLKRTKDGGTTWESFVSENFKRISGALPIYVKGAKGQKGFYIYGGNLDPDEHFAKYSMDDGETWITMDELYHVSFGFYDITTGWSCIRPGSMYYMEPNIYKYTGQIPTSIRNFTDKNVFSAYPNPNTGLFTVKSGEEFTEIEILNILGERVYRERLNTPTIETRIDIGGEPSGTYFIRLRMQNHVSGAKIVIKSP